MSRKKFLLRGPLNHEFLLIVVEFRRGMKENVISGRHGALSTTAPIKEAVAAR
jgi:hypothetical protein